MHSQLYLSGKLIGNPELGTTKKGRLWVKLLLETELVRETRPGEYQTECVVLPISFFSRPGEQVRNLKAGDAIMIGAHLYGSRFEIGGEVKRGFSSSPMWCSSIQRIKHDYHSSALSAVFSRSRY
jgi:hypothetical protein